MISRTLNWLSRYLDLTAEEQIIPRKLESINPSLVVPLEYFWEAVGPTTREVFVVDHSAGDVEVFAIPFKPELDTLLIDWTWVNNDGTTNYFINWDIVERDQVNQTTVYREFVRANVSPGVVTRTAISTGSTALYNNSQSQPRLVRSGEQLNFFVDDGGANADLNELTIRTVEFPKNGPLPRLAFGVGG